MEYRREYKREGVHEGGSTCGREEEGWSTRGREYMREGGREGGRDSCTCTMSCIPTSRPYPHTHNVMYARTRGAGVMAVDAPADRDGPVGVVAGRGLAPLGMLRHPSTRL